MNLLFLAGLAQTYLENSTYRVLPVCLNWKRENVPTDQLVTCIFCEKNYNLRITIGLSKLLLHSNTTVIFTVMAQTSFVQQDFSITFLAKVTFHESY